MRSIHAEGIPTTSALHYSGTLEEEGIPVSGTRNIVVYLWSDPRSDDPGPACLTNSPDTPVRQGRFRVNLSDDCVQAIRENSDLWVEVIIEDLSFGRERIGAVPYAVEADNGVPVGSILAFFGQDAPRGWLVADGRTISSLDNPEYARLVVHLRNLGAAYQGGTVYEAVLPDLQGRVAVARSASDSLFSTLGNTGGSKNHTLKMSEMPEHSHGVNDPGHTHQIALINWAPSSGSNNAYPNRGGSYYDNIVLRNTTGVSIQGAGGGKAHNNLQPYVVVNYIIKM